MKSIKNFVKDHKKEVIIAGLTAGCICISVSYMGVVRQLRLTTKLTYLDQQQVAILSKMLMEAKKSGSTVLTDEILKDVEYGFNQAVSISKTLERIHPYLKTK